MEIKLIDLEMKQMWYDYVHNNKYAVPGHVYEWSDILKNHYKFKFYPIAAVKDGKIRGVLPLYHIRKPFSKTDLLISAPYAVNGGILADSKDIEVQLLQKAVEISKEYNSCKIVLRQYKKTVEGELHTDDNYYNRELTLTNGVDDIWDNITEYNREQLLKAEKLDFTFEYPTDNIDAFYKLFFNFNHHLGMPCASKKWIQDMYKMDLYTIGLIRHKNKIVAGTMIKEFNNTVSFPMSCISHSNENNIIFAYALYWNLIKHHANEGLRVFHSGRIPQTDEVPKFRLGWGGEKFRYPYQYYPNTGFKTDYSSKRGYKRQLFSKVWKIIPGILANRLSPFIVSRFP